MTSQSRRLLDAMDPSSNRPSGTVTFLFTDVEASTRKWEEHQTAMRDAIRNFRARRATRDVICDTLSAAAAADIAAASAAGDGGLRVRRDARRR